MRRHAQPLKMSTNWLCAADLNRELTFEVYDWNSNDRHALIGYCTVGHMHQV